MYYHVFLQWTIFLSFQASSPNWKHAVILKKNIHSNWNNYLTHTGVPSPVSSSSVWRALFELYHSDGSSRDKSPIKHVNWRFFTNTRGWNISNVYANKMTNWQNFISFSLIWRRGIYSSFLIVTIQLQRGEKMAIKEAPT